MDPRNREGHFCKIIADKMFFKADLKGRANRPGEPLFLTFVSSM